MRYTIDKLRKAPFAGPRGGLWADAAHTIHWDPKKHGEVKPTFVAADLITNDKMAALVKRLSQLTVDGLRKIKAEIDKRKKSIAAAGEATPVSLVRWGRALDQALAQAKPAKKTAQLGLDFSAPGPEASPQGGDGGLAAEATTKDEKPSEPGWDRMPEKKAKPKRTVKKKAAGSKAKPKEKPKARKPKLVARPGELGAVGEHVFGSRKDLAMLASDLQAGNRKLEASDLDSMDYDDAAYLVTKQNLVDVRPLEDLRKAGKTPGAASMGLAILAAIKTKAPDSDQGRREYMRDIRLVQGTLKNTNTLDEVFEAMREWQTTYRDAEELDIKASRLPEDEAKALAEKLSKETGIQHKVWSKWSQPGFIVAMKAGKPFESLGASFTGMLKYSRSNRRFGNKYAQEAKWSAQAAEEAGEDGWDVLKHAGAMKAESAEAKRKLMADRKKRRDARGETTRGISTAKVVAGEVQRKGGREIKDANPDRAMKAFGLTNVQYGQYMSQADREYHTKAFEGAMHDFAEIIGVNPKTMSLNGRLALAMGARGRGGNAAAHYESHKKIINLTKFSGGGSLAHEWGHAMDNVLAEHFTKETASHGTYLSDQRNNDSIPDDLRKVMADVWEAMTTHPDPARAERERREKTLAQREVVNTIITKNNELVREANTLAKLAKPEVVERSIANQKSRINAWGEQRAELQAAHDAKSKRGGRNTQAAKSRMGDISSRDYWIKTAKEKIAELESGKGVKSAASKKREAEIAEEIAFMKPDINRERKKLKGILSARKSNQSQLLTNSKEAGEYWAHPWELFARSFESYIEDKLRSSGRKNTYLVTGTRQGADSAYPDGEERTRINAAMDKMMDHLRDTGIIEKSMAGMFTIPLAKALG